MKKLFLWFTTGTLIVFIIYMLLGSRDQYAPCNYLHNYDPNDDEDTFEDDEDLFEED